MTRVVSVATEDLPAEPEALRAFVLAMIAERDAAIAERDELATRNERLHACSTGSRLPTAESGIMFVGVNQWGTRLKLLCSATTPSTPISELVIKIGLPRLNWQRPAGIGRRAGQSGEAAVARGVWVYVGGRAGNKPSPLEKGAITAACERLIAEVLRPRFLPEIRPSVRFNYPIAIDGKWHGNKYRFFTRYRSDDPNFLVAEFDAPFARLDYVSRDCFDLLWHRHTGEWHRVFEHLSLAEALHRIASEPYFQPC